MAIEIQPIEEHSDHRKLEELQRVIWNMADVDVIPGRTMHAIDFNGGVLLGAFDDDEVVGFVFGVIGVPVLLSILWFATFGGSALYLELFRDAAISEAVTTEVSAALFTMIGYLPGAGVVGVLMLVLIVLFVITSANSATFVLGMFTSKGVLVPHRLMRLAWGVMQVMVAGVLLLSGGLAALQTVSILAAFPFMILMIFMAAALLRALRSERRQQELREALLQERLQRLLDTMEEREQEPDSTAGARDES
jgi:glycine betaine transporter